MKYDETDFLEQFDTSSCVYEEEQWDTYSIALKEYNTTLEVTLMLVAEAAQFNIGSLVHFELHNITIIRCDKSHRDIVRFLFYQMGKQHPVVILCIKPFVSLDLYIDQQEIVPTTI